MPEIDEYELLNAHLDDDAAMWCAQAAERGIGNDITIDSAASSTHVPAEEPARYTMENWSLASRPLSSEEIIGVYRGLLQRLAQETNQNKLRRA